MLLIRHAIGSRLFCQTENFDVQQKGKQWLISVSVLMEQAKQIIKFKDELNFFVLAIMRRHGITLLILTLNMLMEIIKC